MFLHLKKLLEEKDFKWNTTAARSQLSTLKLGGNFNFIINNIFLHMINI